ncbi:hypothetical protein N8I77_003383 [Diaporthe amygdali]|uniref:Uncharacterized protein n=1 Tax=Phomopsis amygdali TaxID=1214568 RepID=A0AAD9SK90_PHOAM|nr:hypothetical protein N8I77_003383 [Diaporthe amygdali]
MSTQQGGAEQKRRYMSMMTTRKEGSGSPSKTLHECNRTPDSYIQKEWRDLIVQQYSDLDLSHPQDRLPALAAIAEQIQTVRCHERYLGGLWSGSILEDLLWHCYYFGGWKQPLQKNALDRTDPRLPTWTWASLTVGVMYDPPSGLSREVVKYVADVLKAECKYSESSRFGELESSDLVIRGRVLQCSIGWIPEEHIRQYTLDGYERFWLFHQSNGGVSPFNTQSKSLHIDHDESGFQSVDQRQDVFVLELIQTFTTRRQGQGKEEVIKDQNKNLKGLENEVVNEASELLHGNSDSAPGVKEYGNRGEHKLGENSEIVYRGMVLRRGTKSGGMCYRVGMIEWFSGQAFSKIFDEYSTLEVCDIH